jgi:hypothetical protein
MRLLEETYSRVGMHNVAREMYRHAVAVLRPTMYVYMRMTICNGFPELYSQREKIKHKWKKRVARSKAECYVYGR